MCIEWEEFKEEDNRVINILVGRQKLAACLTQPFRFLWRTTVQAWMDNKACKREGCEWVVDSCLGVDRRYCARCGSGMYQ